VKRVDLARERKRKGVGLAKNGQAKLSYKKSMNVPGTAHGDE